MTALWYLSFATEERFVGGAIVEADGFGQAVAESIRLGCNGGRDTGVLGNQIPAEHVEQAQRYKNRLLSKDELLAMEASVEGRLQ